MTWSNRKDIQFSDGYKCWYTAIRPSDDWLKGLHSQSGHSSWVIQNQISSCHRSLIPMIELDVQWLDKLAEKIGSIQVNEWLNRGIQKGVFYLEWIAKEETPIDTGKLRNSYRSRFSDMSGSLVNTAKYAQFVHDGTKPHGMSYKYIEAWAKRKGLNASSIARSVRQRGTKANPFLKRTVERGEGTVKEILQEELIHSITTKLWQ